MKLEQQKIQQPKLFANKRLVYINNSNFMKNIKNIGLTILGVLMLNFWSCEKQEANIQEVDLTEVDSAETTIVEEKSVVEQKEDFHGKFDAKDPLTYSITLNPNNTYLYKTIDDKTGEELYTTGVYEIHEDGKTLRLDNVSVGPNIFRIEGDQLIELDENRDPKKSDGKINYILIQK